MSSKVNRLGAGLVLMALAAAACGTRLPDSAFVTAGGDGQTGAQVSTSDGVGGGDGLPGGDVTVEGPDGSATGAGSASGGGNSSTGGGGGGATSGGGGGGSTGGGGGGGGSTAPNFASDTGVTANEILVGNIVARGGPLGSETFTPPFHGARAYFLDQNARGGINGRKVRFISCDDSENPEKNKSCARELIENQKIFAMTANSTDAGVSGEIINNAKVPLVGGQPIGNEYYKYPMLYTILGGEGYPRNGKDVGDAGKVWVQAGYFGWLKDQGIKKAGLIFYSTPAIAKQAAEFIRRGLELNGIEVVYEPSNGQGKNPADPSFDTEVIGMLNAGADAVFHSIDIAGFQRLCSSIDKYNGTNQMKYVVATVNGMGDLVKDFSAPCRNFVYANTESWPYTDLTNAEVKRFRDAMALYEPNVKMHQWALEGWVAARLLSEGIASMGANVTRAGLVTWLDGLRSWTGGGLMAGIDWRRDKIDRQAPIKDCFSISQWQDGQGFVPRAKPFTCRTTNYVYYDAS